MLRYRVPTVAAILITGIFGPLFNGRVQNGSLRMRFPRGACKRINRTFGSKSHKIFSVLVRNMTARAPNETFLKVPVYRKRRNILRLHEKQFSWGHKRTLQDTQIGYA